MNSFESPTAAKTKKQKFPTFQQFSLQSEKFEHKLPRSNFGTAIMETLLRSPPSSNSEITPDTVNLAHHVFGLLIFHQKLA